ncbi:MAG: carboxypeptidase-like regulatory domain-containing protein, partial [Bacteroidales bacterium]|nr:carboxypeptidase-like regulatory domain-containing protein [Bacteroidales bacterium]
MKQEMKNKLLTILAGILLILPGVQASAQNFTVKGVVTDAQGVPVAGAGVFIEGTVYGVSTSLDGEYSIDNVTSDASLSVSCIGYKDTVVKVSGRSVIDIVLQEESLELEET